MAPSEPDLCSSRHKKGELRRSEISLGATTYAAPNGAFRFLRYGNYKYFAPTQLIITPATAARTLRF
jgi:hypothetical protein